MKQNNFSGVRILCLILGILTYLTATLIYSFIGYSWIVLLLIITSVVSIGSYFQRFKTHSKRTSFNKPDVIAVIVIILIFVPLYFLYLNDYPVQMNTDEITILEESKNAVRGFAADPLGLSMYFGFPNFTLFFKGYFTYFLGGMDFFNSRIEHVFWTLLTILVSYLFFRTSLTPLFASGGSIMLGASHVFLGYGRSAMWNMGAVFIELAALTFFIIALKRKSLWHAFVGGVITGLSFYVYVSSRITGVIWGILLITLLIRKQFTIKQLCAFGLASFVGFVLVATPITIATFTETDYSLTHQVTRTLLTPEGRELQIGWVHADSPAEGVKINIKQGLLMFNADYPDHSWEYYHPNHGIVDSVTGVLLWIGLFVILLSSKKQETDLTVLCGFFALWLGHAFILSQAPNYGHLLVILPFVSYLVVVALQYLYKVFSSKYYTELGNKAFFIAGVCLIVLLNLGIYAEYIMKGVNEGHTNGNTVRYMHSRSTIQGYSFYLVTNESTPYYGWAEEDEIPLWFDVMKGRNQNASHIAPAEALQGDFGRPPFSVFMNGELWEKAKHIMYEKYPTLKKHNILTDGSRVAVEVSQS